MANKTISSTLTNSYTLTGQYTTVLSNGAVLVNSGTAIAGTYVSSSYGWTLANGGTIQSTLGVGVYLDGVGDNLTNSSGSDIYGGTAGVIIQNAGATVSNQGTIGGGILLGGASGAISNTGSGAVISGYRAISLSHGGTIINGSGATLSGASFAVQGRGAEGFVTNAGTIQGGTGNGVNLISGADVVNQSTGLITSNKAAAIDFAANHTKSTNAAATVNNYGTIAGAAHQYAVNFLAGFANRLIDNPNAVFTGKVNGGNTYGSAIVSTFELASGAGAGTLTGLGYYFTQFGQINVDTSAQWDLTGNNYVDSSVTLTNNGTLTLSSADLVEGGPSGGSGTGTFVNNGVLLLDPSTLSTGALLGTGSATIGTSGTLSTNGVVGSGETIDFGGGNAYLTIGSASAFGGTIAGLGSTDTVDLTNLTYTVGATGIVNSGVMTITSGGGTVFLASTGIADGTQLTVTQDAGTGTDVTLCFLAGTRIKTPKGHVLVQSLVVGDEVVTASGAIRPITWIGMGRVLATRGRRNAATPVIVRKGAIADNVPSRDLRVTKGHSMFIDGVLIPVEFLVNHRSIYWDDRAREVEIYHVELETHDVLIANGAPAESYRDDGNRWLFRNANERWDREEQPPCAPLLTGGPVVDEIWARLLERAGRRPGLPMTDDAEVHLMIDGQRVDGVAHPDGVMVFSLSATPASARIVSRAVVPQELGLARDARMLGVAVSRITVSQGRTLRTISAEDPALSAGFHPFETADALRWTNGDAAIPETLFADLSGACRLELAVVCATRYPLLDAEAEQLAA